MASLDLPRVFRGRQESRVWYDRDSCALDRDMKIGIPSHIGHMNRPNRLAATRQQRMPSSPRRPPLTRHGEALWEREAAGSGSQGAASFESPPGWKKEFMRR